MHKAAGMHLISTCTGNEVGSSYVLAFGSWITFVSRNALGVTLHIGIGDMTIDKKTVNYTYCHDDNRFLSKVERSLHLLCHM